MGYPEILGLIGFAYFCAGIVYLLLPKKFWWFAGAFAALNLMNAASKLGALPMLRNVPLYFWPLADGALASIVMAGVVFSCILFDSAGATLKQKLYTSAASGSGPFTRRDRPHAARYFEEPRDTHVVPVFGSLQRRDPIRPVLYGGYQACHRLGRFCETGRFQHAAYLSPALDLFGDSAAAIHFSRGLARRLRSIPRLLVSPLSSWRSPQGSPECTSRCNYENASAFTMDGSATRPGRHPPGQIPGPPPLTANFQDSASYRWLNKKVLASRLLDDMSSLDRWAAFTNNPPALVDSRVKAEVSRSQTVTAEITLSKNSPATVAACCACVRRRN